MTRVSEDAVPCLLGPQAVCATSAHPVPPLPLPCQLSPPPLPQVRPSASFPRLPGPQTQPHTQSPYSACRAPRRIIPRLCPPQPHLLFPSVGSSFVLGPGPKIKMWPVRDRPRRDRPWPTWAPTTAYCLEPRTMSAIYLPVTGLLHLLDLPGFP